MRIGGLRGAALATALLLGAVGGLAAARMVDELTAAPAGPDPLGIGAALVNQGCSGDTLLIIGLGDTRPALRAGVVDHPDQARYLETDASCPTLYAGLDRPVPRYVVYLGPYESPGQACALRMTAEYKGDHVTRLEAGNQSYVKCPCELATSTYPVLSPDMGAPDTLEGMWINQLQDLLVVIGRLEDDTDETGAYDATTIAAVRRIQAAESLGATGIVDATTWAVIRDRGCRFYDY